MTKSALFSVRKNEPCPQCGAELVIRSGKHGPFLGCSHYPDCDYVRPLKSQADGHIVKVLEGQECPSCGAVMVLRQGRFGMFIGCSRYPECEHTELLISLMKRQLPARSVGKGIWFSAVLVSVKPFIPAIVTLIASSLSISNRWRANALNAITRC
jgi:putative DNA topoisomerase